MKIKYCSQRLHFLTVFFYFLFFSLQSRAQGDLFINPKRVVFEGGKRTATLELANIGKDSASYSISFIQMRMKEDGSFEKISQPDSGQNFANEYLRIFPRFVTLAPKEVQSVKIQVFKSDKLLPGEYRSHLYFRAMPQGEPLGTPISKKDTNGSMSVRLTAVFGISIPVIIRTGTPDIKVTLSNLELQKSNDQPVLSLLLNRRGNTSVYGDLTADHVSPDGKVTRLAQVKGIAVYTPNALRKVNIHLKEGVNFSSGTIKVYYNTPNEQKSQLLASADLSLKKSLQK